MPTYEYGCESCGHQWEQIQRITEAPIEVCPACAKSTAHRLISAGTGFILKGGGWYSDLYSSPSPKPAESAKKADGAESTEKSPPKPDSSGEKTEKSPAKPTPPAKGTTSSPSTT